jgi:hypothetical protein
MSKGITELEKKNLNVFRHLSEPVFRILVDALNTMDQAQRDHWHIHKTLSYPMSAPRREDIDLPTFDFVDELLQRLNREQIPFFDTPRDKSSYYLLLVGAPTEQVLDEAIKLYRPKCLMIGIGDVHQFAASLKTIDWGQCINNIQAAGGSVIIITESDPTLIVENSWRTCRLHNPTQIDNFTAIIQGDREMQARVAGHIAQTLMLSITQLGFFHDECVMLWNTYQNRKTGKVSSFLRNQNPITGMPVFVVASGPSLEQDLDAIHRHQSNAIILSIASALRPLLDAGITPDFHVELENVYITPKLVELSKDYDLSKIRLVAAASVESEVLDYFDHAILYAREALSSYPIFASGIEETLSLPGPTAGNAALSFALESGFQDIYLFGLDLGTRDPSRHHTRGSFYDSDNAPAHLDQYDIGIPGNFVDTIWTSRPFFSAQINADDLIRTVGQHAEVKNCSDGARLNHATPLRSNEIEISHSLNKSDCIKDICAQFQAVTRETTHWPREMLMPEIQSLFQKLRTILTFSKKLEDGSYETELLDVFKLPLGYRDPPPMGPQMAALMLTRGTVIAMTLFMERYRNRVGSPDALKVFAEQAAVQYRSMLDELEQTAGRLFAGDEPNQPAPAEERIASPDRAFPAPIKISRNADCPCGSSLKFKRCHGKVA